MPKVSVYIRKADYAAWQLVEEKTEFIHRALGRQSPDMLFVPPGITRLPGVTITNDPVTRIGELRPGPGTCKHGYDRRFCKHAKPGKPCR